MNTIKNTRRCENCIWYDQCGDRGLCDSYESESTEEVVDEVEYLADLREREGLYAEQVAEQDA